MSNLSEFVSVILEELNESGLAYVVTGSFASIVYSEPRTTMDIDIGVLAPFDEVERIRRALVDRGLYAPSIAPDTDMFNVIDLDSGWKADIIRCRDEPFERARFARRVTVELLPRVEAYVPTVEDMILAKLLWIRGRDSVLQLHDVESMIEYNAESLDRDYLREWAVRLDVVERLDALLG